MSWPGRRKRCAPLYQATAAPVGCPAGDPLAAVRQVNGEVHAISLEVAATTGVSVLAGLVPFGVGAAAVLGGLPGGRALRGVDDVIRRHADDVAVRALRGWSSRRFQVGGHTLLLDRKGMKHILQRHHPDYWDGSVKGIMITVRSYVRLEDGAFQPIEEATTRPPDPDYVEGAIELTVNGTPIITTEEWDYVDQLWAYIANVLEELHATGTGSTDFPDQPIELVFERQGGRVLVSCRIDEDDVRRASADEEELLVALREAGGRFFTRMAELVPELTDRYRFERERLVALCSSGNGVAR